MRPGSTLRGSFRDPGAPHPTDEAEAVPTTIGRPAQSDSSAAIPDVQEMDDSSYLTPAPSTRHPVLVNQNDADVLPLDELLEERRHRGG